MSDEVVVVLRGRAGVEPNMQHWGSLWTENRVWRSNCALAGLQAMQTAEFDKRVEEAQAFGAKSRWRKRAISCVPTKFGISFTTKFLNQAGALVHSASFVCRTVGTGRTVCVHI